MKSRKTEMDRGENVNTLALSSIQPKTISEEKGWQEKRWTRSSTLSRDKRLDIDIKHLKRLSI